jgi:DNA polymerase III epsilon subunit-like protein
LFVVDVETTGPNPFVHDPLMIALVPAENGEDPFVAYVKTPNPKWSDWATENFRGFEREWKAHAREPKRVVAALETYLKKMSRDGKATMVGHNVGFDMAFLRKLAHLAGKDEIAGVSHRALDTHTLLFLAFSKGGIPEHALTSDGAFDQFGVTFGPGQRHTALQDASATRELCGKLLAMLSLDASAANQFSREA